MSRSNIKYEIAKDNIDSSDYYLQQQDLNNPPKKELKFYAKALQIIILLFVYFVLSVGLTFYQKWLYKTYDFNFPLAVVTCHLCIKFVLSALIRGIRRCYKGQQQIKVPWQSLVWFVVPPGIASGIDISLSNWAISLITISLYTMTKSTTIIFILIFSLIFKLEKKSLSLVGIVVMISGGLLMFTYKSTQFDTLGFILCLLASFSSGLRWTMAQIVMQKSKIGLNNPIDMIYHMQLWMLLPVLPITMWFEGSQLHQIFTQVDWSNSIERFMSTAALIIAGAILAFHMEVMEFLVVTHTSSLTLSISGILKEICTLILAYEWKGDQMSTLNFIGLLLCLGGIVLHVIKKILISKSKETNHLEMKLNSFVADSLKNDDAIDTNVPLLIQKSTSLTNLLNASFSSDEEDENKIENSSQILTDILQRREQN
ncbi:solute carrier family 35 member C2 [Prorops nasuta]|uniref:solute carrier family 35 member C2 n=1 Tax=Prorops nasuta TaxID=863751 RepID=UPI0034CDDBCC